MFAPARIRAPCTPPGPARAAGTRGADDTGEPPEQLTGKGEKSPLPGPSISPCAPLHISGVLSLASVSLRTQDPRSVPRKRMWAEPGTVEGDGRPHPVDVGDEAFREHLPGTAAGHRPAATQDGDPVAVRPDVPYADVRRTDRDGHGDGRAERGEPRRPGEGAAPAPCRAGGTGHRGPAHPCLPSRGRLRTAHGVKPWVRSASATFSTPSMPRPSPSPLRVSSGFPPVFPDLCPRGTRCDWPGRVTTAGSPIGRVRGRRDAPLGGPGTLGGEGRGARRRGGGQCGDDGGEGPSMLGDVARTGRGIRAGTSPAQGRRARPSSSTRASSSHSRATPMRAIAG